MKAEMEIANLTNKVAQKPEKRIWIFVMQNVFYRRWWLSNISRFCPTVIWSEMIKRFDTNLEFTIPNLANGRVNLIFNRSILVKKVLLHCIRTWL